MNTHIKANCGTKTKDGMEMWAHRPRTELEQADYDRLQLWFAMKSAKRTNDNLPEVPVFGDFK